MQFHTQIVLIGITATLAVDLWAFMLGRALNIPTTNWGMVGRWFAYLRQGVFIHRPISRANAVKHEHLIGWVFHYSIGIVYAYCYLFIMQDLIGEDPTLLSATLFGVCTVLAPWLVLQPGVGLGVFARFAEKPMVIRMTNLSVHILFGATLFIAWLVVTRITA